MDGATEGAARISAAELRTRLLEREDEIAVLDVRTERRYGDGHLLVASNAPLHHLESDLPQLIPRRATPTVLCSDNGDGLAEQAAGIMKMAGYLHPLVLEGGIAGCQAAEFELFSGLNTPSKVLAAFMRRELEIPELAPEVLARAIESGEAIRIIDCRPAAECGRGTIPGAINVPAADLTRLPADFVRAGETLVITCAGRSRGLTGAQILRDLGFPGKVLALERGTMGWELSGRQKTAQ